MIFGVVFIVALVVMLGGLAGEDHSFSGHLATLTFLLLFGSGLVLAVRAL